MAGETGVGPSGPALQNKPALSLGALASNIRHEIEQADRNWYKALEHALRAGALLTEAKAQLEHGQWLPWLQQNFELTPRHAQNYMKLAANAKRVSHLPTVREAMAMLTAPKPEPADDDEATERAARARVVARWGEQPHENPHIEKARLYLAEADIAGERAALYYLEGASEAMADRNPKLAAAASRMAAASLAEPWERDETAWEDYLEAGGALVETEEQVRAQVTRASWGLLDQTQRGEMARKLEGGDPTRR